MNNKGLTREDKAWIDGFYDGMDFSMENRDVVKCKRIGKSSRFYKVSEILSSEKYLRWKSKKT